jgi:hypothetical protein
MSGANTVIGGAFVLSCCGGVSNVEGFTVGAGNKVGNPPEMVLFKALNRAAELAQPFVIEENDCVVRLNELVQLWTSPGIRPATAVTWNDEMVSKAIP